jgi:hypothetical protein
MIDNVERSPAAQLGLARKTHAQAHDPNRTTRLRRASG